MIDYLFKSGLIFWLGWVILPILLEFIPSVGNFVMLLVKKKKLSKQTFELAYKPPISVIVPIYNSSATLEACIKSIDESTYPNELIDVLCVDNGSKDNSFEIFQKCQSEILDLSISWVVAANGKSKALNKAIFNSEGKYVINIDSDGKLDRDALENVVKKFESDEKVDCMTGAILIEPALIDATPPGFLRVFRKIEFMEYCQAFLAGRNFQSETNTIFTLSGAFSALRKSVLSKTFMYNTDTICEDAHLTFQVKEILHRKVSFCDDAIFMVDPIDNIDKYYTQRQRWQIGELEVLKMFVLKKMKNPLNMIRDSSVRTLIVDHTLSFTKFVWLAVMIVLCLTNKALKIVGIATIIVYLMSTLVSFMYGFNSIQFLKKFPEIRKYYIKNIHYLFLLPIYNLFAFIVRLCGILNSINRKSSWKTLTFTDEKAEIHGTIKKDFSFVGSINVFFRKLLENYEEDPYKDMILQYRYKFYLNANHYVVINDKRGDPHSHCFEIVAEVASIEGDKTTAFNNIERKVDEILKPYQNKLLNDIEPFDEVIPTLENICRYFKYEISKMLAEISWVLLSIEVSETPSRSFMLTIDDVDFMFDELADYAESDSFYHHSKENKVYQELKEKEKSGALGLTDDDDDDYKYDLDEELDDDFDDLGDDDDYGKDVKDEKDDELDDYNDDFDDYDNDYKRFDEDDLDSTVV